MGDELFTTTSVNHLYIHKVDEVLKETPDLRYAFWDILLVCTGRCNSPQK